MKGNNILQNSVQCTGNVIHKKQRGKELKTEKKKLTIFEMSCSWYFIIFPLIRSLSAFMINLTARMCDKINEI